jgi:hypothetical protein
LRELGGEQLFVVRKAAGRHVATIVGSDNSTQGTIRLFPEAFLAPAVIVC